MHAISHRRTALSKLVKRSLDQLGLDYIDVLLLAGCNEKPGPRLMEHVSRFQEEGLVRFLGVSSHHRTLFPELEKEKKNNIDVFHLRYNAAHRGAEQEVFERMPGEGGPGIVAFASNRWGSLFDPRSMPPGDTAPSPADCYRFVLSHPSVHVACCGPGNMTELQQDLECLDQGPMEGEELERMRRIGEYVYKKRPAWRAQLRAMLGALFPRSRSTP